MLTIISGNNRNGYPYALNKVSDIFQCGIPPIETEGLIDLGKASQKEAFSLAGSLSLIFSSIKATATGSAGVTVSMTSGNSVGYGKWEPCSSLAKVRKCNFIKWLNDDSGSHFSPESAKTLVSAKSRHHQIPMPEVTVTSRNTINGLAYTHMVGVCADNLLNIKPESAFVQTTGKEKGPRPALLSTLIISSPRNSQGLEHNWLLQATGNLSYSRHQHPNKTGAGLRLPSTRADISHIVIHIFWPFFEQDAQNPVN
ncbi:hypothetical protein ACWWJF_26445 [Symbiopectobacterium sp. Eva_TO]